MDGHRNFPDDPPSWYGTGSGYGDDERNRVGGEERNFADDAFRRVPEPRGNQDPRYDRLSDTHERRYGTPGTPGEREPFDGGLRFGEPAATSLDPQTSPYEPGRRVHDTGTSGFEPVRPYGDPTVTAERTNPFDVSMPTVGTRSGEPLPPLAHPPAPSMVPQPPPGAMPSSEPHRMQAESIDRAALRRGPAPAAPVGEGVYRVRRPLIMIVLAAAVILLEIPAFRVLLSAAFGEVISAPAVIGATFLIIGVPLFALGVHTLATGAAKASGPATPAAWLRPPLVYLSLGLALFFMAALAIA